MSGFTPFDLTCLIDTAEKVTDLAESNKGRVIVEIWDRADNGPIAWVECHPVDSAPTITFTRPVEDEQEESA